MKEGALSVRKGVDRPWYRPGAPLHAVHQPSRARLPKAGATREQILEAAGVSVLMQGGPAFTHVPEVLTALEYLEGTTGS